MARSVGEGFGILPEFDGNVQVHGMSDRGLGYCVEWVMLEFPSMVDPRDPLAEPPYVYEAPIGFRPLRIRWIGSKTMADPRYQPCENPVKVPAKYETFDPPSDDANDGVTAIAFDADGKGHVIPEPSQPALPLDIEAATEATMRAAVALGNQAADWLRAKGLTL